MREDDRISIANQDEIHAKVNAIGINTQQKACKSEGNRVPSREPYRQSVVVDTSKLNRNGRTYECESTQGEGLDSKIRAEQTEIV